MAARAGASTFPPTSAPAWPPVLTATQDGLVTMAHSKHSYPDDCFHCPQGDKPCPATYQPGAWLTRPRAEPPTPATPDHPPHAGELEAAVQQALRKLREAVADKGRQPG
jgi:hypothetical protein